MMDFLSDEAVAAHKEQLRLAELRYSIISDSIPVLKNINIRDIARQKISRRDKSDAVLLLGEVLAHRAYFSSFTSEGVKDHPLARRFFGSSSALRNRMYELARPYNFGFVALSLRRGELVTEYAPTGAELYLCADPILVIDLWEHAYFYDYGFDRERYLSRALSLLDLDKLNEIENIG